MLVRCLGLCPEENMKRIAVIMSLAVLMIFSALPVSAGVVSQQDNEFRGSYVLKGNVEVAIRDWGIEVSNDTVIELRVRKHWDLPGHETEVIPNTRMTLDQNVAEGVYINSISVDNYLVEDGIAVAYVISGPEDLCQSKRSNMLSMTDYPLGDNWNTVIYASECQADPANNIEERQPVIREAQSGQSEATLYISTEWTLGGPDNGILVAETAERGIIRVASGSDIAISELDVKGGSGDIDLYFYLDGRKSQVTTVNFNDFDYQTPSHEIYLEQSPWEEHIEPEPGEELTFTVKYGFIPSLFRDFYPYMPNPNHIKTVTTTIVADKYNGEGYSVSVPIDRQITDQTNFANNILIVVDIEVEGYCVSRETGAVLRHFVEPYSEDRIVRHHEYFILESRCTPMVPIEPIVPDIPLTPLEPAKPIVPLTPLEPSTPIEEEVPMTPLEPTTPVVTPEKPKSPENVLPPAGVTPVSLITPGLFIASGSLLSYINSRKKKDE